MVIMGLIFAWLWMINLERHHFFQPSLTFSGGGPRPHQERGLHRVAMLNTGTS